MFLADCKEAQPVAVGHRVVHGGPNLRRHCLVNEAVLRQLEAATVFAPLHNPPALSVIRFAQEHFPQLPQVACFDTAFHAGMPDVARTLPLPLELQRKRVEMRFAHLKTHHRFERMRLRGFSGARDEFHLAAIVQNLKTLASYFWRPPPHIQAVSFV
jgi:acetate kinase